MGAGLKQRLVRERPANRGQPHRRSRERNEAMTAYAFLLPDLLGLLIFVLIPIGYAFYISLHDWNAMTPMRWVGAENYQRLLQDDDFWNSLETTALYTLFYVPLLYCVSLGLALVVNQKLSFMPFFRTVFFIPVVLSLVVSSLMWKFVFDEQVGLLNYLIGFLGIPPVPWLGSVYTALPAIIVVNIWINMGYFMVIFIAGLKDIPKEYFEAARIDGASPWSIFWRITLPLLRPTSLFVVVISIISSFQIFDQVWIMTQGGPANATEVTAIYMYRQAFQNLNLGYGAAVSFGLFVVIMTFSAVQFRFLRSAR
jgi:multiple sugar transport system permease protein